MKKKYCVDYKIGNFCWRNKWFNSKEERDTFAEKLNAFDTFKTKKYIVYLNDFDIIKVERNK